MRNKDRIGEHWLYEAKESLCLGVIAWLRARTKATTVNHFYIILLNERIYKPQNKKKGGGRRVWGGNLFSFDTAKQTE